MNILSILNENFYKFVREDDIKSVIEDRCLNWTPSLSRYELIRIADNIIDGLKPLFNRYTNSGQFATPTNELFAKKKIIQILNLLHTDIIEDVFEAKQRNKVKKDKRTIIDEINKITSIRINELLRII